MKAYLINLARRPDRLYRMSAQLARLGISFQRIEALDAQNCRDADLQIHFTDTGPLGKLSKGDKCCTLSHMLAWRAIVASGDTHGVVLEDDIEIDADGSLLLRTSEWIPSSLDVLKLEHYGPAGQRVLVGEVVDIGDDRAIGRLRSRHTGAAAYILSHYMAQALLDYRARWTVPVDHMLFNPNNSPLAKLVRPCQLIPAIARQSALMGGATDIGEWRTKLRHFSPHYAWREMMRAYFELRLLPSQLLSLAKGDTALVRIGEIEKSRRNESTPGTLTADPSFKT